MAEIKEVKWGCGCHEVDGVLATQCTQHVPPEEVAAHHTGKPYSKVCFRLRQEVAPEPEQSEPEVDEEEAEHEETADSE